MSLHRQLQCQRAHQQKARTAVVPRYCYRGTLSEFVGDRSGVAVGRAPSVKAPLDMGAIRVNTLFAILFQKGLARPVRRAEKLEFV
jgi:hypothetical protein